MSKALKSKESQFALLKEHEGIIHKLCFMYSNNNDEYKDLRQEVSYQLLKSYNNFKGDSKLSTWVYKVALYTSLAYIRRKPKTYQTIDSVAEVAQTETENKDWYLVMDQIKKLPDAEKSLMFLYLEDNSYKEIAEILGITESNVGVKLNRIKKKLKEYFTER